MQFFILKARPDNFSIYVKYRFWRHLYFARIRICYQSSILLFAQSTVLAYYSSYRFCRSVEAEYQLNVNAGSQSATKRTNLTLESHNSKECFNGILH